jgi:hypothetical protein
MTTPSETVQAAQRLLAEREIVGLAKYGTTVDRTDLQAGDWLQHAIEEASDLLLYLIRLQQTAAGFMPRVTSPFTSDDGDAPVEDPDRAAYLARWANAPAEATHLSEDSKGIADWWKCEPKQYVEGDGHKIWIGAHYCRPAPTSILGRVACEPRPGAEGER